MIKFILNRETIDKLTLEDMVELYNNGICCVTADGRLKYFTKERKENK